MYQCRFTSGIKRSTVLLLQALFILLSHISVTYTAFAEEELIQAAASSSSDHSFTENDAADASEDLYYQEITIDDIDDPDDNVSEFFMFLDEPHDYLSDIVESTARNIDDYFVDDLDTYVTTGSYLSLKQHFLFKEGGKVDFESKLDLNLRIPNTEKKLNLFFASPDENQPYELTTQAEQPVNQTSPDSNFVVGVQGESGERFGWKYKPVLGANIREGKLDPFVRLRFIKEVQYQKWKMNWQETPYWFDSIGRGVDSYLEFDRRLDANSLFRISTFIGWKDQTDMYDLNHVYTLFHTIGKYQALSYYAGVYGETKPHEYDVRTTRFLLGINYRQSIHRDYFFYELSPQISYPEENNFAPVHTLLFTLELIFKR